MKGDFSRLRFNPAKNYTSVLQQQGRVSLDSDANEQAIIDEYLRAEEITDIVGKCGGPKSYCGFKITFDNATGLSIGPGRYYVEGIACENDKALLYPDQPYLITTLEDEKLLFAELARGTITTLQVYLQVWKRLVTSLDDPCLREPALGMADTTARLQTVWRVILNPIYAKATNNASASASLTVTKATLASFEGGKIAEPSVSDATIDKAVLEDRLFHSSLESVPAQTAPVSVERPSETVSPAVSVTGERSPVIIQSNCCQNMAFGTRLRNPGKLWAQTSDSSDDCSCEPTPASGYRGLENQLYRVEVHTSGTDSTATFKWSRENASLVVAVSSVSGKQVFVDSLGPDANLGFKHGDWVEISDDTDLFGEQPNQPGTLYQIDSISRETLSITMKSAVGSVDLGRNSRLRRWDQSGTGAVAGGIGITQGRWFSLENGIEVQFAAGEYITGDYWLIPARTATGNIEWPPCGSEGGKFQPAIKTPIFYASLACITLNDVDSDTNAVSDTKEVVEEERQTGHFSIQDCRKCFSPLTALMPPAKATAMHITEVSWQHDDILTADYLVARGLFIAFDQVISSPITGGNFIVTVELIEAPADQDDRKLESWSIQRSSVILETTGPIAPKNVAASATGKAGAVLHWTLPYLPNMPGQLSLLGRLAALLNLGATEARFARVRIRLVGRDIYSGSGANQIYLDGQVFGEAGTRADGSARVALKLPSGNGEKASDFESWFYLAPELLLTSITTTISTPQNAPQDQELVGTALQFTVQTGTATVTLSYAPIKSVTVQLVLTLQNGTGAASDTITIPSALTFAVGEKSKDFTLKVVKEPSRGTAVNFQLTASLKPLVGPDSVVSTNFTLGLAL